MPPPPGDFGFGVTFAPPPRPVGDAALRVLIVEDHHDLAEALQVNLRGEGYRTVLSSDGRQALALVRAGAPDLIVLDLGLPGMDGLSLLARLRAEGIWCPVLILSARDADADKVEGFRLGADDYVTKPFRPLELMARIDGMARRIQRERAVADRSAALRPAADGRVDVAAMAPEALAACCGLTLRQAEVARGLAAGRSNPEIAAALGISRFTARNHVEQILVRLGVESRWQVTAALQEIVARARGAAGG